MDDQQHTPQPGTAGTTGTAAPRGTAATYSPTAPAAPREPGAIAATFTLVGRLEGLVAPEFSEPLEGARVRLYRPRDAAEVVAARAAALAKDTLAFLSDDAVAAKAADLLAEAPVGPDGRFEVTLGTPQRYAGGPLEIDVYCGTVPRRPPTPRPPRPLQFSVTTVQPRWRAGPQREEAIAAWEFTIPGRFWCAVRARFDAWVVCGRVRTAGSGTPVPGVRVRAFDVDWLQNDAIGSDVTDAAGRYRIDYTSDQFTPTVFPFVRLEWVSGPDLYFRVETAGGTALLTEPPSRGRAPDRENCGHCKVVNLELAEAPPGGGTETQPITSFFQVGRYHAVTGIDAVPATGTGRTLHPAPALANRAFFATLPLRGVLGKQMPLSTDPLEYRFEFAEYPLGSTNEAALAFASVPLAMVGETQIGILQLFDPMAADPADVLVNRPVLVNAPPGTPTLGAPPLVPPGTGPVEVQVAGGWIRVPQNNNVNRAAGGLFVANTGLLLNLASAALAPFETVDCGAGGGLQAGEAAGSEGRAVPREHFFAVRMMIRAVGTAGPGTEAGRVRRMAVSNPTYTNISLHPSWNPTTIGAQFAVASVDVAELAGGGAGCTRITTALTARYTAAHPNMGAVTMQLEGGPTPPQPFALPAPASTADQFGVGAPDGWTVPGLAPCSYLVKLTAEVRVTTGESEPAALQDYVGFCK